MAVWGLVWQTEIKILVDASPSSLDTNNNIADSVQEPENEMENIILECKRWGALFWHAL